MERLDLTERFKNINTAEELAEALDEIKQIEFDSVRYCISEKMLRFFSSDSICHKRFRTFHIRKKSGGLREIKAPCRQLYVILKCVNILLKSIYEPSDVAMGFVPGRSVFNNAQIHVGHNYVFNIDLKDFFPSIPQARVWKRLQLAPFNFSQEIANILAGLCCSYDANVKTNVLPQGSPASPLLTNAICDKLDRRMKGVAKRFGLHYSRYADDMTFSSMHNVYQEGSEFRTEIQRIISDQGFRMNESKTRLQKTGTRQEVTGLTVNAIVNVTRKYISDLRWILSVWEKDGYSKAYAFFYPKYKHEKGYIKKGEPVMENVIGGKLDYLRMVRGESNSAYQKLATRFAALQELVFVDNETDDKKSYVYVQPYTIADFQSLFHTTIYLQISKEGKVIGKCSIDNREKVLAISKTTQKILCPDSHGKSVGDSIYSEELEKCFVTLCRNKGKNFWLITQFKPKRSRCLSIQNLNINPDELLTLWEKIGFDATAYEFAQFIQFGKREESILEWNLLSDTDNLRDIDRGNIANGKVLLIKYFLQNKNLSRTAKARLSRLILETMPDGATDIDVEHLLDVWEKDGLDAAVNVWKKQKDNKSEIRRKSRNEVSSKKDALPEGSFFDAMGISEDVWIALQKELEMDTADQSFVDLDGNLNDIPYNDSDSKILAEL